VNQRFLQLTGKQLDPYWRAPGGKLTPNLLKAGEACGYRHVAWAPAGFSGDELSSEKFSNALLLKRALDHLRDGDIFMAHLGIWSRKQAWAPENLEPLITGLEQNPFVLLRYASILPIPLANNEFHCLLLRFTDQPAILDFSSHRAADDVLCRAG
jgi:peptidoglycan/xylan/chitin deacetylase (PgdA/CDA1 family)